MKEEKKRRNINVRYDAARYRKVKTKSASRWAFMAFLQIQGSHAEYYKIRRI